MIGSLSGFWGLGWLGCHVTPLLPRWYKGYLVLGVTLVVVVVATGISFFFNFAKHLLLGKFENRLKILKNLSTELIKNQIKSSKFLETLIVRKYLPSVIIAYMFTKEWVFFRVDFVLKSAKNSFSCRVSL